MGILKFKKSLMPVTTQKKTFSIKKDFVNRLDNYQNKSQIINKALYLYFSREDFLEKSEKDFIENFSFEWVEYFSAEEEKELTSLPSYKKLDTLINEMTF